MHLAIIGGGLSGALLAIELIAQPTFTGRITLFERVPPFARGVAYSTPHSAHLLNVPAARMSARAHEPHHFIDWLAARRIAPAANESLGDTFVPRPLYAAYLAETLMAAQLSAGDRLDCRAQEVVRLQATPGGMDVHVHNGDVLKATHAVLSMGHMLPRPPRVLGHEHLIAPHYVADPWDEASCQHFGAKAHIALLGAGLTMVDVALRLAVGADGQPTGRTMLAVSRHGYVPLSHVQNLPPIEAALHAGEHTTARAWTGALAARLRAHRAAGGDWRQVIDSLRGQSRALWQGMGRREQARFLRHGKALWDLHRHRVAPQVGHRLQGLRHGGRLTLAAGRLVAVAPGAQGRGLKLTWRRRHDGGTWHSQVDGLINCTGGHSDVRRQGTPLWEALKEAGLIRPGPHGAGVDVDGDGRVLSREGVPAARLWALGPLRVGQDFESVAVPELREQARALAQLCGALSAS